MVRKELTDQDDESWIRRRIRLARLFLPHATCLWLYAELQADMYTGYDRRRLSSPGSTSLYCRLRWINLRKGSHDR